MTGTIDLARALDALPSLANEAPHKSRSEAYKVISTAEVLQRMVAEGFEIVQASEARVRLPDNRGFQKHLVRMRHPLATETATGAPDVLLINSHNGASAFKLFTGWIEFACSNGLIIGTVETAHSVRHVGDVAGKVITAAYRVIDDAENTKAEIADMRATVLPSEAIEAFETRAHALRFGDSARVPVSPGAMGITRRAADANQSLWSVYNRIQENVIRGGMRGRVLGSNGRMRRATVRPVTSIDKNVSLNTALHGIAREMLATYGHARNVA
jgi:hypothetical protein